MLRGIADTVAQNEVDELADVEGETLVILVGLLHLGEVRGLVQETPALLARNPPLTELARRVGANVRAVRDGGAFRGEGEIELDFVAIVPDRVVAVGDDEVQGVEDVAPAVVHDCLEIEVFLVDVPLLLALREDDLVPETREVLFEEEEVKTFACVEESTCKIQSRHPVCS